MTEAFSQSTEAVDDSWIFESLGCSSTKEESRPLEVLQSNENQARTHPVKKKHIYENTESVYRIERAQLVENMYSLLLTARIQIRNLEAEKKLLENKLDANALTRCPKCFRTFDVRKNLIKPSYIRVLKARNTLELTFDDMDRLKEWLQLNSLENNKDGLPVLLENNRVQPTLRSTRSLLANTRLTKTKNSALDLKTPGFF